MKKSWLLLAVFAIAPSIFAQTATINWADQHQVIDGFGAADAQIGASMSSANQNFFFGLGAGQLGLSILRAGVTDGAGDPGSCLTVSISCAGVYISDMNAVLAQGGKVYASPWSPPAAYKTNSSINCSPGSGALATADYGAYATWLANFVQSLKTEDGITLDAISVQNEPDQCQDYDSALWTQAQIDTFVKTNLGPTFSSDSLSTLIFIPETSGFGGIEGANGALACMNDSSCYPFIKGNVWHDYDATANSSGSVNTVTNPWASYLYKYWETEVSCGTGPPAFGPSGCESGFTTDMTTDGLMWAGLIDNRTAVANANAYLYWWLISQNADNEGLMSLGGTIAKRAYVFGQYSKFIRPGYTRIDATHNPQTKIAVSAYQNVAGGNFVTVATNYNASIVSQTFCVTNGPTFSSVTPYVTSTSLSLAAQSAVSLSSDCWTYSLPAQSVVSFVGTASPASLQTYYISPVGSDSNAGTSKAAPWAHSPDMPNYTGSHVPVAGDNFIFRGCDTFPAADFAMAITQSGTATNRIYFGVDQTWWNTTACPSAWNRPIFNATQTPMTGNGNHNDFIILTGNYVTIDWIEFTGLQETSSYYASGDNLGIAMGGTNYTAATHNYWHGWSYAAGVTEDNVYFIRGDGCMNGNPSSGVCAGSIAEYNICDGADTSQTGGNCIFIGPPYVAYNYCQYEGSCYVGNWAALHDNVGVQLTEHFDGGHGDLMQANSDVPYGIWAGGGYAGIGALYYNNVFAHVCPVTNSCGGTTFINGPTQNTTSYIFNNVIFDTAQNQGNVFSGGQSLSGAPYGGNFTANNTVECGPDGSPGPSGNCYHVSATELAGNIYSSFFITSNATPTTPSSNLTITPNPQLAKNLSQANTAGYSSSQTFPFSPTSGTSPTVGVAPNLTSTCNLSPLLTPLCSDTTYAVAYTTTAGGVKVASYPARNTIARPTTGNWDAGAYQFGSATPVPAVSLSCSPSGLTFSSQSVGTQSAAQNCTLTNTGTASLSISLPIAVSPTTNFSLPASSSPCPATVAAGANCIISVVFGPTVAGSLSATVSITDNASNSPQQFSVSGTGAANSIWTHVGTATPYDIHSGTTCVLTISPTPVIGNTIWAGFLSWNNTSSAPVISSIEDANGNAFTVTPNSPSTAASAGAGAPSLGYMLSAPSNYANPITITWATSVQDTACFADSFQVAAGYTVAFDTDVAGSGTGNPNNGSIMPATPSELFYSIAIPANHITAVASPWVLSPNAVLNSNGSTTPVPVDGSAAAYALNVSGPSLAVSMTASSTGVYATMEGALEASPSVSTPTISSLSPPSGNELSTLDILGTNFGATQDGSTAKINSTTLTVNSWATGDVNVTIPTGAATGNIVITVSGTPSNGVLFTVTAHLASLSLNIGPVNTSVTATGTGFGAAQCPTVMVGSVAATNTSACSDTSVTFTVPTSAVTGAVTINGSNSLTFTVTPLITSATPGTGPAGTGVTLGGFTFGSSCPTVTFGGASATPTTCTSTSISAPVPSGAPLGSVNIVVTTPAGASAGFPFTVTSPPVPPLPVISSLSPIGATPNIPITINGSNFGAPQGSSTIAFCSLSGCSSGSIPVPSSNITSWSNTQIVLSTYPAGATGTMNIVVTTSVGASNGQPFTVITGASIFASGTATSGKVGAP